MKKRILITGSGGYLGAYLTRCLHDTRRYNLYLFVEDLTTDAFDLPDVEVVIHLAGKPNSYKGDPAHIMETNYGGTVHLARRCPQTRFVFLSSDYVFRSAPDCVYTETDRTDPETLYGQSKARAEAFLMETHPHAAILRTSMLYGYDHPRRKNFFKFVEEKLERAEPIALFSDVYSKPTFVADLCKVIERIVEEEHTGIFHACGSEYVSRYQLGALISQVKGYDPALLSSVKKPDDVAIPQYLNMKSSAVFTSDLSTTLQDGIKQWGLPFS